MGFQEKNYARFQDMRALAINEQILSFYKSNLTERWWMEISSPENVDNILTSNTLLPCTYFDYENACNQNIPERWFNAKMKYEM